MSSLEDAPKPEGGAGWYPNPLGQRTERFFDGSQWTAKIRNNSPWSKRHFSQSSFWKAVRRVPMGARVTAGVVAFVAIAGIGSAIEGGESTSSGTGRSADAPTTQTAPKPPPTPQERREAAFEARRREVLAFKESIAEEIDDDTPKILCSGQTYCGVTYEIDELLGVDIDEELLNDQRDVWSAMFGNPKFKSGFIELEGHVESIGGKTSVKPALRVRCDRRAARQIDWENVRAEGFKQLCDWDELISG